MIFAVLLFAAGGLALLTGYFVYDTAVAGSLTAALPFVVLGLFFIGIGQLALTLERIRQANDRIAARLDQFAARLGLPSDASVAENTLTDTRRWPARDRAALQQRIERGISKVCPSCGAEAPAEKRLCPHCSHDFDAPRRPT